MKITKSQLIQIIKEELALNTDFESKHFSNTNKKNNIKNTIESARMKLEIARGELSAELGDHPTVAKLLEIIKQINNFEAVINNINDADEMIKLTHADFMSKARASKE